MTSMKCTIPGVNLKVFGRAIQSLSKIGDELYLEPLEDGLYLRSVNSCRSAYACFQFSPSFFLHYVNAEASSDDNDDVLRCKLGMKSIMAMFKSLPTIDKTVEKCRISLDSGEARLVFQMYCRHGIIKTHKLAFTECETLQAVFSKGMCPNKLTAAPKLLCDAVLNFQNNQEEITLIVRPNFVALKNYVDDELDPNRVVHTELTLSPDEFEQYQAGVDADITFCLKEFRAILAFADITNLPVTLHFESAGRPVTLSITSDLSFEANFVLATLTEVEDDSVTDKGQASTKVGSHKINSSHHSNNRHVENHKNSTRTTSQTQNPSQCPASVINKVEPSAAVDGMTGDTNEMTLMMDVTAPEESYMSQLPTTTSDNDVAETCGRKNNVHNDSSSESNDDSWDGQLKTSENSFNPLPSLAFGSAAADNQGGSGSGNPEEAGQSSKRKLPQSTHTVQFQQNSEGSNDGQPQARKFLSLKSVECSSPIIPLQDTNQLVSDEEENDNDEVPATPPSKKFRSLFFGTQSSTQSTQSQKKSVVLAPDSEEDD